MKTSRVLLVSLLAASPVFALKPPGARTVTHAEVVFLEPEKFTDVRDNPMEDYRRTTYLDQLRDHLLEQAKFFVPEGHTLKVTFTDVDMAGDFEPWRESGFNDVRIVKSIYPPTLKFTFRLTDADGKVVKDGVRELRGGPGFMLKITGGFLDDRLRHEKALVDDWLRTDFPRVRKS
jgi:hypothetical protein